MSLPTLPIRRGDLALADLVDLYMAHYTGRDVSRGHRVAWWRAQLGSVALQDLTDDRVFSCLQALGQQRGRYYAGKDAEGRRIFKARDAKVSPATLNRYAAALGAVLTWAIKCRIAPVGYVHPCRALHRNREDNEKTRFLSDDERTRLLEACRASKWPRLYVLVLMALTTGARKGELMGLRWADIDLERAVATLRMTKAGTPRVLPLVPNVVTELQRFLAGPKAYVFASPRDPARPFAIGGRFIEAMRVAKIRGATFHSLRHSTASYLAQSGASLLEIAEVLGHRQLQTTKRYAHWSIGNKAALVNRVLGGIG